MNNHLKKSDQEIRREIFEHFYFNPEIPHTTGTIIRNEMLVEVYYDLA